MINFKQFRRYLPKCTLAAIVVSTGVFFSLHARSQLCPFRASAASALLMEAGTGEIVYSQNPHQRLSPASLAKIMTLFLVFDAISDGDLAIDQEVEISRAAAQKKGSTMYLQAGEKTQLTELIKGIAIVSGNDACIAVAEKLSGTEQAFVDRMNRKIQALGLLNTKFQTVDGWPADDQYTTAHDMAMLARAYIENHPQALAYHKLHEFSHADIVLHNRNRLVVQDPTADGLKTGHVEQAGFHLVATAERNGRRFIAVVMGAADIDTREREATQLLEFGFDSTVTVTLFGKGDTLTKLPVRNGVKSEVNLVPVEDGRVEVPLGHKNLVAYRVNAASEQHAPVEREEPVGNVLITYRDEVVKTIPLVAAEKIERSPAPDSPENIERAATPAQHEKSKPQGYQTTSEAPGTTLFPVRKFLLAALAVLLVLLLIQWIYIVKLRGRIARSGAADVEVIKKRLEKFIQNH